MWIEKYAPRSLDDVVMPETWRREFESYLPRKDETQAERKTRLDAIPSMLFAGRPGTGKNSIARVLINAIAMRDDQVVLGGDNPPTAQKIRDLREFLTAIHGGLGMVFVDEADSLAPEAQRTLQISIERYQAANRFILATNHPENLGDALKSRLRLYDFGTVSKEDVRRRIEFILLSEKRTLNRNIVDKILDEHHPDIRKIIQEVERACIHGSQQETKTNSAVSYPLVPRLESEGGEKARSSFPASFFAIPLNRQRVAERVADYWHLHGLGVRCVEAQQWMVWASGRWQELSRDQLSQFVLKSIRDIGVAYDAESESNLKLRDALPVLFKAEDQVDAIIKALSRLPAILADRGQFDSYEQTKWRICCENGIVDLQRGSLEAPEPDLFITKCLPCEYNPTAECPKWLEFLDLVFDGDQELIEFVRRALGYSLIGSNEAQCIFVMLGEKARNGKSTFLNVIKCILGSDYYESANASTFTRKPAAAKGRVPEDLHRLRTARFVGVVETERQEEFDVALIKKIAGGDDIVSRTLYKESESYKAPYTVWIATNHMPAIDPADFGIRRKVLVIPFEKQIPEEKIVANYHEQLLEEKEGILAWIIEGCKQYVADGLDLNPPDGVRPDYKAPVLPFREMVVRFIDVCTERGTGLCTGKEMLWRTFLDSVTYFQMGEVVDNNSSRNQFGRVMSDLGFNAGEANPRVAGETVYTGLRLRTTEEMAQYLLERSIAEIDKAYDKKRKPKGGPEYDWKRDYAAYDVWVLINAWCKRRPAEEAAFESYQMECIALGAMPVPFEEWIGVRRREFVAREHKLRADAEARLEDAHAAVNEFLNRGR